MRECLLPKAASSEEVIARAIVEELVLGGPEAPAPLRMYCATCDEYLDANPLDADAVVVLIHAMAEHRVVLREALCAGSGSGGYAASSAAPTAGAQ